jgi:hypothetical protein
MKPIKAYAVVKDNKLDAMEIYEDKEVLLDKNEKIIKVMIVPYEDVKSIQKKVR